MSDSIKENHYFKLHIHSVEDENTTKHGSQYVNDSHIRLNELGKDFNQDIVDTEVVTDQFDIDNDVVFKVGQDERKQEAIEIIDPIHFEKKPKVLYSKSRIQTSDIAHENSNSKVDYKGVFLGFARQVTVSLVVLVLGFILLNASSFYENAKYQIKKSQGYESPLHEIATEVKDITYSQKVLETSSDPEIQKKLIPALDMEVAPVDDRIIIPRIDKNIPIIRIGSENVIKRDWTALESQMQEALKNGVVYYPGTSQPGQTGNVVITGHSSYFPWDPGRFKDVFALLHEVVVGDKIVVYHDQDKYLYEISEIKIVKPNEVDVLKQTPEDQLTLITCTPVGTNLKRLIVIAKPVQINNSEIIHKIAR